MGVWCLSVPSGRFASCQKTGPGTNTVATGAHAPWMVGAYLRVGFAGGCPFGEGRDLIILGGGSEIRGVLRADAQGLIQIAEVPYRVVGRVDEGGNDACACADVGLRGGSRIINDSTGSTEFLFLLYSIVLVTIHSFAASLRCTVFSCALFAVVRPVLGGVHFITVHGDEWASRLPAHTHATTSAPAEYPRAPVTPARACLGRAR